MTTSTMVAIPPFGVGPGEGLARHDLNESAYGPLPEVEEVLRQSITQANRYPEFLPDGTRRAVASHLGVPDDQVTIGAGATGVIAAALRLATRLSADRGVVSPELISASPTFNGYPILADMTVMRYAAIPLGVGGHTDLHAISAAVGADTAAIALSSPHNPTGTVIDDAALIAFLDALPRRIVVLLDQAYIEYCAQAPDLTKLLASHPRLVVIRTFSKAYGLAALRVGYGVGSATTVAALRRQEVPFAISGSAAAAVPTSLALRSQLADRVALMRCERTRLAERLRSLGAQPLVGEGNFIFLPDPVGATVAAVLTASGVAVKDFRPHGVRITVGDRSANDRLISALRGAAMIT